MQSQKRPVATIALAVLCGILFLICEIRGGSENSSVLISMGALYSPLVEKGEVWRYPLSMFLHAGIRHLLNNLLLLCVIGFPLERQLGWIRYLILYLLGGLGGSLISYRYYMLTTGQVFEIGASGAVFAVIGGLLWIILRNRGRVEGLSLQQMLIMLAFSLYFGFATANVANSAHIGGLVCGFILSILLYRKKEAHHV